MFIVKYLPRFFLTLFMVLSAGLALWTRSALADDDDDSGKRLQKSRASVSTAPAAEDSL